MAGRGGDRGGRRGGTSAARRPESVRRTRPAAAAAAKEVPKRQPVKRTARLGPLGLSTTRRAAVLATVVCALALSVAVPLRTYLSQRSEVQIQEQRQAELRAEVEELERRKAQLADPAQIQAEAKRRLRYVMPGETPYMVELPAEAGGPGAGRQPTHPISQQAWYQALWDSVHGAGR